MNYVDWSKLVKIVGAIGFVAVGFLTYGDGVLFEQIYIALLVFMAVVFIRDINIVSIIFISAAANLSSKFLYPVFLESDYQTLLKIMVYGAIALTLLRFKTEAHRKSVAGVVGLCIAAEIYWIATDYNAPYIYWNVLLININILVRYFLFQRVFIVSKYFPKRYRSLDLDITLHDLVWYFMLLHMAILIEYLVRHILDVQITTIYYASPYIFHGLTTFSVLLILFQGYKVIRYEWFKA